jgi:hypothetical protein
MIGLSRKRKNTGYKAKYLNLLDVIATISRDRNKWRKLALKRARAIGNKNYTIEQLEEKVTEQNDELVELAKEIDRLKNVDDSNLVVLFAWEEMTYHQRERIKRFADVMKGYITYEEFYRANVRA